MLASDPENGRVFAMGWPETAALVADCELVEGCTDREHVDVLCDVAKGQGARAGTARRQLAGLDAERVSP
jgi:hypothetical protein